MKTAVTLPLKIWLPLLVWSAFLLLGIVMICLNFRNLEAELLANSLSFVRQDMSQLQREMEKEISIGNHVEAGHAIFSRGVNLHYKVLLATDDKGIILHATQRALVNSQVVLVSEFDTEKFQQLVNTGQADIVLERKHKRLTAYYPLALSRSPNEIRPLRRGMLFLVYDLQGNQVLLWKQVWEFSVSYGVGSLIVMIMLYSFLNHYVTRPIQHLVETADNYSQGDYDARVHIEGRGELARLGHAYNDVTNSLKKRLDQRLLAEKKSREKEQLVRDLLEATAEAIYGLDMDGKCTFANRSCVQMLGYENVDDLIGRRMHELAHYKKVDGSSYSAEDCPIYKSINSVSHTHIDSEVLWRADGSSFFAEYWAHPVFRDGIMIGVVVNFLDLSERKKAESQIRILSMAVEQSPVSVTITDVDANIEYVNSKFEKNTGYSSDEVIGKNPRFLQSGRTPEKHYKQLWQAITLGKTWKGVFVNKKKTGEVFWEYANIAPVRNENGEICHYVAAKEDITLRKRQHEKILHQAHYDSLTDLPNRFLALDRLSQLISEAARNKTFVAVLFLDLDDFKKINDSLGHETGDKLLVEAASRLTSVVRSEDTVGRLGGDEFIVLLRGITSVSDSQPVVESLLNRFRKAFDIDNRELILTSTIGVATYPVDGMNPSQLLRNADSAMYHAKEMGRNTYSYFTESMNKEVSRRFALEEQIHGALERGELSVLYQPQFDIVSNTVIGAEALLRWHNQELGQVSPEEFIPIAEQSGLIVPIGKFVLQNALTVAGKWIATSKGCFRVAVNLSPRQFRDPNLTRDIKEAIKLSHVSANNLELEITEGVLMSGHHHTDKALRELSDMGICISMDDFGTGYSSLSYLRRYPFDVLKIDRSFIKDLTESKRDEELINATVAMAHALGLKVVAEGVETSEQLSILRKMKCDIAQGYFFSKPVDEHILLQKNVLAS